MRIRRPIRQFPVSMKLTTLLEQHYIPAPRRYEGNAGHKVGKRRIRDFKLLCRLLRAFLQREPLIGDLDDQTLAQFEAWHVASFPHGSVEQRRKDFDCLRHFCGLKYQHRRGRNSHPLSDEPGTLWHICCNEYFPKNHRIQSTKTTSQYKTALCDFKAAIGHDATLDDLTDDNLSLLMKWGLAHGQVAKTCNERVGRLKALWNWCWRRARRRTARPSPV